MKLRFVALGIALGLGGSMVSCGQQMCSPATCASGCCSSDGQCLPGSTTAACGTAGKACAACQSTQSCNLGVCGNGTAGGAAGGSATGGGTASAGGTATAGGRAGGTATAGGSASAGGTASAGGSASAGGTATAGGSAGTPNVVVNEIFATGGANDPDYVELFNAGTAAQDLSGYSLTDTENTDGGPKPREGVVFPAGTTLTPGGFLLVVGDRADAGATADCLNGPSSCFSARFGLSQNGESVFLLDAQGAIHRSQAFPSAAAPAGSSYGRFPDGTGSFATTRKTPGAANAQ